MRSGFVSAAALTGRAAIARKPAAQSAARAVCSTCGRGAFVLRGVSLCATCWTPERLDEAGLGELAAVVRTRRAEMERWRRFSEAFQSILLRPSATTWNEQVDRRPLRGAASSTPPKPPQEAHSRPDCPRSGATMRVESGASEGAAR